MLTYETASSYFYCGMLFRNMLVITAIWHHMTGSGPGWDAGTDPHHFQDRP